MIDLPGIDDRDVAKSLLADARGKVSRMWRTRVYAIFAIMLMLAAVSVGILLGWKKLVSFSVGVVFGVFAWSVFMWWNGRVVQSRLRSILMSLGRCSRCGYKVSDVQTQVCPECGCGKDKMYRK